MKIGMLWQDFSKLPLADKINQAAAYYAKKYGATPTLALVNPQDLEFGVYPLTVLPDQYIAKNHIWIGVAER